MSEADMIIESLKNSGRKVEEFYTGNKTSDKNVGSIEEDIRILQEKDCMWHYPETRIEEAIENIIADYTRQKQINEEHQKINGDLREKVKKIEKENSTLKNFTSSIFNDNVEKEFIPKQKIKDMFEESQTLYEKKLKEIDFDELKNISLNIFEGIKVEVERGLLRRLLQESEDK